MVGIERIKIISDNDFLRERSNRANEYNRPINDIYRKILPLADGETVTETTLEQLRGRYDANEGIDVIFTLRDGSKITLQEKCLFKCYNTVTFETRKNSGKEGAWFYCTAQLYFCAQIREGRIEKYVLIELAKLKILSNQYELPWQRRVGKTRSREEFMFMKFTDIPEECLYAKQL